MFWIVLIISYCSSNRFATWVEGNSHISEDELHAFDYDGEFDPDPEGGGDREEEDEISFRLNSRWWVIISELPGIQTSYCVRMSDNKGLWRGIWSWGRGRSGGRGWNQFPIELQMIQGPLDPVLSKWCGTGDNKGLWSRDHWTSSSPSSVGRVIIRDYDPGTTGPRPLRVVWDGW